MSKNQLIIGTRGSQLALYQANKVKSILEGKFPSIKVDIKIIKTKGDKILDVALSKIGDKGVFTKELEVAMLNNEIDLAVHSLKDMATQHVEGLKLGAVIERGDFRDALISKNGKKLSELTTDDIIATSSLRRRAALLKINPDFKIIDIRGNVQTRLKKMNDGHCDVMIMAAAGFKRLELDHLITEVLEPEQVIPAVGQGVIAIECRSNDEETIKLLNQINHTPTEQAILAEREYMRTLEGGCQVPVGCYSTQTNDSLTLTGFVASLDGTNYKQDSITGPLNNSEPLGRKLAEKLIASGAKDILKSIRS